MVTKTAAGKQWKKFKKSDEQGSTTKNKYSKVADAAGRALKKHERAELTDAGYDPKKHNVVVSKNKKTGELTFKVTVKKKRRTATATATPSRGR